MFDIDIERNFSAAHTLVGYKGDCSNLHGHNWLVQATIRTEFLDEIGIAVDFKKLKKEVETILEEFDHTCINEHSEFKEKNPTSENLAFVIANALSDKMNTDTIKVYKVRVCESPNSGATYYPQGV